MHTLLTKENLLRGCVAVAVVALVAPMLPVAAPVLAPQNLAYLVYLPDAMVETAFNAQAQVGNVYIGAVEAYVAMVYTIGDAQQATYKLMGDSMADGATEVGAAYQALLSGYAHSDAKIQERLQSGQ